MALTPVTGIVETGQVPPQTSFTWDADPDADFYAVGVDAGTPVTMAVPGATVTAPAGAHTLSVAPGLVPTAPVTFSFSVPGPPPPPPAKSDLVPILAGAGVLGIAALALSGRGGGRSSRRSR